MTARNDPAPPRAPYASPRAAFFGAVRDYCGLPATAMAAAFVGFGAVVNEIGFGIVQAVASTAGMTLIAAQVVMIELHQAGAGLVTIALAVAFVGARLLPMVMALMPLLREGRTGRFEFYAGAFPLATMCWSYSMRRCPALPPDQRMAYYWGVALLNWVIVMAGTALGYALADIVPPQVMLGLVFLMPVFFLLLFIAESPDRAVALALVIGGVLGPVIYLASPEWSLLGCGLIGGTVTYALRRRLGAS